MSVSIKQLTINTKVNKQGPLTTKGAAQKTVSKGLSKLEKEAIIQECMDRVRAMIEYELNP